MLEKGSFAKTFDDTFKFLDGKKIVLYGIGYRTGEIIEQLNYNIVGLMDREKGNIGKVFWGVEVLDNSTVEKNAEAIIIVAVSYWETIYKRIQYMQVEKDIPIYFLNGKLAENRSESDDYQNNECWKVNFKEYEKIMENYDVVSFDLFDTLICRKVLFPENLFDVLQKYYADKGLDIPFTYLRKDCENKFRVKGIEPNIEQIYIELKQIVKSKYHLDIDAKQMAKREIELESTLCVARKDMVYLFRRCIELGKEVYIVSDTYFDKYQIHSLLKKVSIHIEMDKIITSCDLNRSKSEGTIWSGIYSGEKWLHIGDDDIADIVNPRKNGVHTLKIYSSREILKNSSFSETVDLDSRDIWSNLMAGHCVSKLFNSPFKLSETKGKVNIDSFEKLGYVAFGPIIASFLYWIKREIAKDNIDQIVFVARDGYFLIQDYLELRDDKDIPAKYLKTSRALITNININNENDIKESLNIPYRGTMKNLLKDRYDIFTDDSKLENEVNLPNDCEDVYNSIEKIGYINKILENAKENRKNYVEYLADIIGTSKKIGVVDFGYSGSIQYNLCKIIDIPVIGYYLLADMSQDNKYNYNVNKKSFVYNEQDLYGTSSKIYTLFSIIESVFTAPNGTYKCCKEKGEFTCYDKMENQNYISQKEEINNGIKMFLRDIKIIYEYTKNIDVVYDVAVDIMYDIFSSKCSMSQNIKRTFWMDDVYKYKTDRPIFDIGNKK